MAQTSRSKCACALFALLMTAPVFCGPTATVEVSEVMTALANARPTTARFTERRWVAVLDRPIDSAGELSFEAPDRFVKRTLRPKPETLSVEGSTVRVERNGRTTTFDTSTMPQIAAIVTAVRGTLTGDRRAIERAFALSATGSREAWTLALLPSDPAIGAAIAHIRIVGERAVVRSIEIVQADGDRSVMSIDAATRR